LKRIQGKGLWPLLMTIPLFIGKLPIKRGRVIKREGAVNHFHGKKILVFIDSKGIE